MNEDGQSDYERIRVLAQETRLAIVQVVLGHPCMMPSIAEVDYYIPSRQKATLTEHVEKLVEVDVLDWKENPHRKRDEPGTFVVLTDSGYRLLDDHNLLLDELDDIRDQIAKTERTAKIRRYERARRPTVDVDYDHPLVGDGEIVDPTTRCAESYPDDIMEDTSEMIRGAKGVIGRPS